MIKQLIYFAQNIDGVWHRGIVSRADNYELKVIYDVDEPAIIAGITNSQQALDLLTTIKSDSAWTAVGNLGLCEFLKDKWTLATAWMGLDLSEDSETGDT